jgi:long-chain alkane monooxygenase
MHLMQMLIHSASTHTLLSWADPADRQLEGLSNFGYWQDMARTLERGCFDAVFFADSPATHGVYWGSTMPSVQYGVSWPNHDPMPLIAVMAAATERLGFGVTLSTTGTTPYLATRRISTLNYLTRGRVAWNIVSSPVSAKPTRCERHVAGLSHDQRYDYADEFMEICYRLWDSVPPDAIEKDMTTPRFADPARIRSVDFEGQFLRCKAVGPILPEPGGRPLLIHAGSSGRGMQFAVKHAELIFGIQPHVAAMKQASAGLREAARAAGIDHDLPVLYGLQPILGSTEREASQRAAALIERIPLDAILARLSGADLSQFDPDDSLAGIDSQASRGLLAATASSADGTPITLREAASRWALSVAFPQVIGTPEQVADRIEAIWRGKPVAPGSISARPPSPTASTTSWIRWCRYCRRGGFSAANTPAARCANT